VLEYVHNVVINDADYCIYCFWKSILYETDEFIRRIKKTKINIQTWLRQKSILEKKKKNKKNDIGFATFFLNRCNRSGILNAGPIGGLAQNGNWKIDARFNKHDLIKRIERIAYYKDRIEIYNLDAIELLNKFKKRIALESTFIYMDPPYYVEGKNLYLNYYNNKDHVILSDYVQKKLKTHWLISYDNVSEIRELYKNRRSHSYNLRYSANKCKIGNEILFYSESLKLAKS